MKVYQSKLTVGTEGKVLIDSTNKKSNSTNKNNKKKSDNLENNPSKTKRKDGIYTDPSIPAKKRKFIDTSTQTEPAAGQSVSNEENDSQKVIDMMTSETPTSEYWEALAETRREALKEALDENKFLKDENDYLKGENKILEEMLEEAKQLAVLIQSVTGDKDSDLSETSASDNGDENIEGLKNEDENERLQNGDENETVETLDEHQ